MNDGIDARVLAASNGTVTYICPGSIQTYVVIRHPDGEFGYAHLDINSLQVQEGDCVAMGQWIGNLYQPNPPGGYFEDNCGSGWGRHIHFWVPYRDLVIDGYTGEYYANLPYLANVDSSNHEGAGCCCRVCVPACSFESTVQESGMPVTLWLTPTMPITDAPSPDVTSISETALSPLTSTYVPISRPEVEPQRIPPVSSSYRIPKSVFGSGGGEKASTHYVINSTQGQSTDLSRRTSASYVLTPGYWSLPTAGSHQVYLPLVVKNR